MTTLSDSDALRALHLIDYFRKFWRDDFVQETSYIMDAIATYFTAGADFIDKPATIENVVDFFTAVARERWTKAMPVEEAITSWSDVLKYEASDKRMAMVSLMVMVNNIMRQGNQGSSTEVWRAVYGGWKPEMSVVELMSIAPIFI